MKTETVGHTPWSVQGSNVKDSRGRTIANVFDPDDSAHLTPRNEAIARLIALAPELLEELKSRVCGGCGYRIGNAGSAMECGSCKRPRALVAKATES